MSWKDTRASAADVRIWLRHAQTCRSVCADRAAGGAWSGSAFTAKGYARFSAATQRSSTPMSVDANLVKENRTLSLAPAAHVGWQVWQSPTRCLPLPARTQRSRNTPNARIAHNQHTHNTHPMHTQRTRTCTRTCTHARTHARAPDHTTPHHTTPHHTTPHRTTPHHMRAHGRVPTPFDGIARRACKGVCDQQLL
jgi:hypothetical protein